MSFSAKKCGWNLYNLNELFEKSAKHFSEIYFTETTIG